MFEYRYRSAWAILFRPHIAIGDTFMREYRYRRYYFWWHHYQLSPYFYRVSLTILVNVVQSYFWRQWGPEGTFYTPCILRNGPGTFHQTSSECVARYVEHLVRVVIRTYDYVLRKSKWRSKVWALANSLLWGMKAFWRRQCVSEINVHVQCENEPFSLVNRFLVYFDILMDFTFFDQASNIRWLDRLPTSYVGNSSYVHETSDLKGNRWRRIRKTGNEWRHYTGSGSNRCTVTFGIVSICNDFDVQ